MPCAVMMYIESVIGSMEVNVLLNGVNIGAMASRGHENNLRCGLGLGRGCACGGFCADDWPGEESETSRSGMRIT